MTCASGILVDIFVILSLDVAQKTKTKRKIGDDTSGGFSVYYSFKVFVVGGNGRFRGSFFPCASRLAAAQIAVNQQVESHISTASPLSQLARD